MERAHTKAMSKLERSQEGGDLSDSSEEEVETQESEEEIEEEDEEL
jgi:hypothetical protein